MCVVVQSCKVGIHILNERGWRENDDPGEWSLLRECYYGSRRLDLLLAYLAAQCGINGLVHGTVNPLLGLRGPV
jgi:hypothetical protein